MNGAQNPVESARTSSPERWTSVDWLSNSSIRECAHREFIRSNAVCEGWCWWEHDGDVGRISGAFVPSHAKLWFDAAGSDHPESLDCSCRSSFPYSRFEVSSYRID